MSHLVPSEEPVQFIQCNCCICRKHERRAEKPIYVQSLLPPLMSRWNSFQDDDRNLISVMETLSVMASAMGTELSTFARGVYDRCLNMIEMQVTLMLASPDEYSYDFDFLVCALDLLAGLAEGVGPAFIQLTQIQILCSFCRIFAKAILVMFV